MIETAVRHRSMRLDGYSVFYREAGSAEAPVLLLPHGYPCSSYQYRNLMPRLADRWRLLAPDFPGAGYTDTPQNFRYDFDGFADFLEQFLEELGVQRFVIYLQDFGSQIGLRLAIRNPQRIAGVIIQNGDIYEDVLGPKYEGLKAYFRDPTPAAKAMLSQAVSLEGFKEEFLNNARPELAPLIPPDLWRLHWSQTTEQRRQIFTDIIAGLKDNLDWFPRYQAYLREHQPAALIVWGPQDGYMPEKSARAYLRDLPNAELHLLDGGHWLLETCLDEVVPLVRNFLQKLHGQE
ncbi:alpha/beta fold hydrolase [Rhizobiales bacterium RZME27]|uniref:Alpha/beta fold hydrolase n=1 Tax=Endobacterium cereale TaxID=2663029 RepID=A0A6A8AFE3_9HYPH|nr:alpha/beta hydrolase [Endobacterium cereale]MEB2842921.1 alpha/beta hydrolase [Endobacterium cereale]MQY49822.1 alpha/beta fold hydrolase [Endobacterium cereale]